MNIDSKKQKLLIYIFLTVVTLAVYWQVNQFDFVNIDDETYVTSNSRVQSGITIKGIRLGFCYNLRRILASFDLALPDARLSVLWS